MAETGFLRNNLGWIIPSGVIVLAATGFFEPIRQAVVGGALASEPSPEIAPQPQTAGIVPAISSQPQPQPQSATVAAVVTRSANAPSLASIVEAASQADLDLNRPATLETALPNAADLGVAAADAIGASLLAGLQTSVTDPEPAAQPAIASEPIPVAAPVDPSSLFSGSGPTLEADASCIGDLRMLAEQTRIYFPSGGVSADESGLSQARIIAELVQDCPGVRIEVRGHSDPSGNPASNLRLSERRAEVVIKRLAAMGADTSPFVPRGMGDRVRSTVTGPEPQSFYDRRVEFAVIENGANTVPQPVQAAFATVPAGGWQNAPCVAQLQQTVAGQSLLFGPRSVTANAAEMESARALAAAAAACPGARLRIIGQYSDAPGSGETPATARLRAKVVMTMLASGGIATDQMILAAPSEPQPVAGRPGLSERRVDFDVIIEES